MLHRMIRSAVVLAAFSAAVVLGTAGFASAGVTRVPAVVGVPSPSPLALSGSPLSKGGHVGCVPQKALTVPRSRPNRWAFTTAPRSLWSGLATASQRTSRTTASSRLALVYAEPSRRGFVGAWHQ
jgi:hypothetical protein